MRGSPAFGGIPVLLVCGDTSLLKQLGSLRASVSQEEASFQLLFCFVLCFRVFPLVQWGLLGMPGQDGTSCFQENPAREASCREGRRGEGWCCVWGVDNLMWSL